MTALLEILAPGAMTTVQDLGRIGFRGQGVPLAGVLDRVALRLVNALLGNDPGEAVLEVRLTGPRVRVGEAPVRLALGGGVSARVARSGKAVDAAPWTTVTIDPGEILEIRLVDDAMVGLVGIAGGLDLPPVLGSRSTYVRAGIGGLDGRSLAEGDRLRCRVPAPPGADRRLAAPFTLGAGAIRVLPGPQENHFTSEALETVFSAEYEVTKDLDRMGIRLSGPSLAHHPERGAEILSEGMAPGCIQVPGSGQPILVLADGQTVGGYPKPGVVISADLPRLAALRPGDRLRFQAVTLEEAEAALDHLEGRVQEAIASITEDRLVDGYDLEALQSGNLIGGVVDMAQPDHFPGHLEETPPCA
ncbi:MAG: biotin-dependent carboxyltransferase family protein [Rhodospirillum sp.]|nr:biotin-dependent carboxyltransferase family protein [Rhodospirillum sp.]MCF8488958.1 biotin-dependent carboxyltransferase family protein [Rhodospirillum sp.]MCF8499014.1 biotin-dependent carboxyltransferase family protein [Rhodospirillum sp.]